MMRASFLPWMAPALLIAACAAPGPVPPSLLPRAAEHIDPRLPVGPATAPRPVDPALAAQLSALVAQAMQGDAQFRGAMAQAERLAASAGPPQSESWIVAQQAVSAAVAARGPTTRALGDIDELAAAQLERENSIAPADLAAIGSSAGQVRAIEQEQARRLAAVEQRLRG